MARPKLSIVIPIHARMKNGDYFLWRSIQSLMDQTFQDFEIIITQQGTMPVNTNAGIERARGELIKILYLDDYLAHPGALQLIVDNFKPEDNWLVTGCVHQRTGDRDYYEDPHSPHYPQWTPDLFTGNNRIGSPSVLTLRNKGHLLFDTNLTWLLDCDFYMQYFQKYGPPKIVRDLGVVIGVGDHQMSNILSDDIKIMEQLYLMKKYAQ